MLYKMNRVGDTVLRIFESYSDVSVLAGDKAHHTKRRMMAFWLLSAGHSRSILYVKYIPA